MYLMYQEYDTQPLPRVHLGLLVHASYIKCAGFVTDTSVRHEGGQDHRPPLYVGGGGNTPIRGGGRPTHLSPARKLRGGEGTNSRFGNLDVHV
jgi:hypothetical protein